jgi:hypothetical protein
MIKGSNTVLSIAIATALFSAAPSHAAMTSVHGVVAGSLFTPPVNSDNPALSQPSNTISSVYVGAKVCFDLNNNGICDANEPSTVSKGDGTFTLTSAAPGNLIAQISTSTTMGNRQMTRRSVLRVAASQIAASSVSPLLPVNVAVTPLSTEALRMVENEGMSFADAKAALAQRLGVDPSMVLADPNTITDSVQKAAVLAESVVLTNRFTLAAKMVDRGDVSAVALAVNPGATGPLIQIPEAQQVAMNIEGIPRYDHIFIVMLENKATNSILNSPYAPNINHFLQTGNQFTNYYATGNPSEPNYTALGGADDFGITNDDQWNCNATGPNAPQDLPLPTNTQPGLASSPFAATCVDSPAVDHNIVGHPNLFNALTAGGMAWRTYNESTNPGQDYRTDGVGDAAVIAKDHVYAPGTLAGNTAAVGDANLNIPMPAALYRTKHHPGMAYQNVRSAVEFKTSNRTLGGGQWDDVLLNATAYAIPPGYNKDQFGTDLTTGDIGAINFVIPDQCDDMHSITVTGTDSVTGATKVAASDCGGVSNGNAPAPNDSHDNIIARGDNYVNLLVSKIENSPIWQNTEKRVAIVLMFDEGNATTGFNSCCGWNPGNSKVSTELVQNPDGSFSADPSNTTALYTNGNRGHGNSIFAVLTNQPNAPKGVKDSDAYSHFSFVRTLQDMFGLADPGNAGSYMNRSKYTESFIAANILNLPEYASSGDTHFDAVRPMNHRFVIPAGYVEKQSSDESLIAAGSGNAAGAVPPQVGPDANQINVWAVK